MQSHQVIIIGSGPAGLTAAIYSARANLSPLVFLGSEPGGQLMTTTHVENYPGFPDGILGPELMEKCIQQAKRFGATLLYETVTKVDFSGIPHRVFVQNKSYQAPAVIVATGASSIWLGLPSEQRLRGHGVSSCATCDGAFFRDKIVLVVGGGDSAMEEALFLTKFARHVTIVHRRDSLRASKIMQQRVSKNPKISFQWNSMVKEILGQQKVDGAVLENVVTQKTETFACDGVFVAIGHKPNTELFKDYLPLDRKGYIHIESHTSTTSIPGVFISGDVSDFRYRQAVTAAAAGCKAAIDAERWLEEKED